MKKHVYHVDVWGDFVADGASPAQVRGQLIRIIRHEGHKEVNFEITIERLKEDEVNPVNLTPAPVERGLDKRKKSVVKSTGKSKRRPKKNVAARRKTDSNKARKGKANSRGHKRV